MNLSKLFIERPITTTLIMLGEEDYATPLAMAEDLHQRIEGSRLTRHEYDDLYNGTFTSALNSRILLLAGQNPPLVVPSDIYRRLARDLRANGCMVIADLSGDDLREAGLVALSVGRRARVQRDRPGGVDADGGRLPAAAL